MTSQHDQATGKVLPIAEEIIDVEKRRVLRGKVRVQSVTDVLEEDVQVDLESDELDITRVPIGQRVTSQPPVRTEGDVIIVPVLEEVLVVEKHLMLVEEVHLRRRTQRETVEVPVSRRRQRVVVDKSKSTKPNK